jgi:hypothetical protein
MKQLVFLIIAAIAAIILRTSIEAAPPPSSPIKVRLTWDPPATNTPPATGYIVYRQDPATQEWVVAGKTTTRVFDVTLIGGGTYGVTAYNDAGESDLSDPFTLPGVPGKPVKVRATIELGQ